MNAPIALFVYNRLEHIKKTVAALQQNHLAKDSDLVIFSDGGKNQEDSQKIQLVRAYLKTITSFHSIKIIERVENYGLANSIIDGVTEIVNQFGKVIVLEDDLITSPYFLQYMNEALVKYENNNRVLSVHGYLYPTKKNLPETFFIQHTSSWGWATWKRAWDLFEPDGAKLLKNLEQKNLLDELNLNGAYNFSGMLKRQIAGQTNSWAIRWNATCLVNDKLSLYPGRSLVQNIGQADGSGTNRGHSNRYLTTLSPTVVAVYDIAIEPSMVGFNAIRDFFINLRPSLLERVINKLK